MASRNIGGEWRGHYAYPGAPDQGSGFAAFFLEKSGRVDGSVIDDFWPGKATVSGSFTFPNLQFTKVYDKQLKAQSSDKGVLTPEHFLSPVLYEGTMTEDGKTLSGTWTIAGPDHVMGTWTAHRPEDEAEKQVTEKGTRIKEPQVDEHLV